MDMRSKLLKFPNQDRAQEKAVTEFSGAVLHRLRSQDHFFTWEPSEDEMLLALSNTWVALKKARAQGDKRAVQELSGDLGVLSLKCFTFFGK